MPSARRQPGQDAQIIPDHVRRMELQADPVVQFLDAQPIEHAGGIAEQDRKSVV